MTCVLQQIQTRAISGPFVSMNIAPMACARELASAPMERPTARPALRMTRSHSAVIAPTKATFYRTALRSGTNAMTAMPPPISTSATQMALAKESSPLALSQTAALVMGVTMTTAPASGIPLKVDALNATRATQVSTVVLSPMVNPVMIRVRPPSLIPVTAEGTA